MRPDLRLSGRSLRPNIGVVELDQQLPPFDTIALFDEQALDGGCNGRMRFEVAQWLNLAISRYQTANGATLSLAIRTFKGVR